jgi:c-di-GMP-binding flagellar brake protein YcgR
MFAQLKKHTENVWTTGSVAPNPSEAFSGVIDGDREYFRIDTTIGLRYWPLRAGGQIGTAGRRQVNLSGGGIRFALAEPLRVGERVWLEMILPDAQSSIITCIGRVVRRFRDETGWSEAAFEFVKLATRDQDRIIAFCLAEQRILLRQKVRVSC